MRIKALRARTTIIAVAIACVALILFLGLYTWYVKHTASTMLHTLMELRPGLSSSADAERYVRRFRRYLLSHDCDKSGCRYEFRIKNTALSRLHLEPSAAFTTGFTVRDGTVIRLGAGLVRTMDIYPTFGGSAGIVQEYSEFPEFYSSQSHYTFPTPIGKPYLMVKLDSHASAEERKHAFEFSFRCLTKLGGGCDLPCDYLPSAWRDWKVDLQTSGFPMSDFNQTYRRNERCN